MVTVYVSGDTGSAPVLTGLAAARVARASVAAVISRCTILDQRGIKMSPLFLILE